MNPIKNLLQKTPYHRLALHSLVFTTAAMCVLALAITTYRWVSQSEQQPTIAPSPICNQIMSECLLAGTASDAVICKWGKERDYGVVCPPAAPVNPPHETWLNIFLTIQPLKFFEAILGFSFLVLVVLSVARFITLESHPGWQRLSILSGVTGGALSLYWLWDEFSNDTLLLYWYVWTTVFFLGPLALRTVYRWVNSGFSKQSHATPYSHTTEKVPQQQPPLERHESTAFMTAKPVDKKSASNNLKVDQG